LIVLTVVLTVESAEDVARDAAVIAAGTSVPEMAVCSAGVRVTRPLPSIEKVPKLEGNVMPLMEPTEPVTELATMARLASMDG
jgi:hypothetical protein